MTELADALSRAETFVNEVTVEVKAQEDACVVDGNADDLLQALRQQLDSISDDASLP